jgi:hypothetical protein
MVAARCCAAPGCEKARYVRGRSNYCSMHRYRLMVHGSLDLPEQPPPKPDPTGYMKHGHEWVHRIVLRAVIGDEPHPCHWCNRMLRWGEDLFVDHLDEDKLNNDPHNLVPACNRCNSTRSRKPVQTCKRGHEFSPANTYVNATSGSRVCRTCSAAYKADWQRARRQTAPGALA